MTWARRTYPLLFAIFPVLGVAAKNPGYYSLTDAAILSLVAMAGIGVVYLVLYGLLRPVLGAGRAGDGAALGALVVVALVYLYHPLLDAIAYIRENPRMGPAIALLVTGILVVAWVLAVYRYHVRLSDVGRFLSLVAVLLVGWSVVQLAVFRIRSALEIRRSALVQELARPVPTRQTASTPGDRARRDRGALARDVYIIIFDEYANAEVLRERFGIDNRPVEDSLRALGFRVPASVRSNYANTLMSIASFLNFAQLEPLAHTVPPRSRDFRPAAYLLEHNRAARFLQARGYRFVFFPSSWYGPTRQNHDADEQFRLDTTFVLGHAVQRSEVTAHFVASTLLDPILRPRLATAQEVHVTDAARTLAGLTALPRRPEPTFALAHLLVPHIPYMEDAACRPLPRGTRLQRHADSAGRAALAAELQCLNRQILHTVRTLIAQSDPQPIIILQGDHGTQSLNPFGSLTALPTPEQARERFQPFGAYYLPDGGGAVIPDSTSMVNILRYVFSYYFDADLPPLPNTMYYSHWERPYGLTEVGPDFHVVQPGRTPPGTIAGDRSK